MESVEVYITCLVFVIVVIGNYVGFKYALKDRKKFFNGFKKVDAKKIEIYDNYHARKENNIYNIA